jgi:SAUR family protein
VFRELPRQAEEEYGFPPCDEGLFGHVLRHLSSSSTPSRFVTLGDIKSGAVLSGCCASSAGEALPLLLHQGVAADEAVW